MATIKVACVQMCSSDDVRENIAAASALIRQAKNDGAEFIATPEMTSLLDKRPEALFQKARSEDEDEALQAFRKLSAELQVWLLIGSLPIKISGDKCANRSFLLSPQGEIVARYDKMHMFDADVREGESYRESNLYKPGSDMVIAKLPNATLGLTICYDLRFPDLYRSLAKAGAQILSVPSSFTVPTGEAHWHVLLRARAIENGCFVIAPAQSGKHADGRETFGHSLIIGPWGEILAEGGTEPGVIRAELDLSKVDEARRRIPSLKA
jgi:predicted amidohydrolase